MTNLKSIGKGTLNDLQKSIEYLYGGLIQILKEPDRAGTNLLQAVLHTFAISVDLSQFQLLVNLGLY